MRLQSAAERRVLNLAEWAVTDSPLAVLGCLGLGSCVAIMLHDPERGVGGMAHTVLPDSTAGRPRGEDARFVDLAAPMLLREVLALGAQRRRLRAHLVGGAQMLRSAAMKDRAQIGLRNVEAAHAALVALGLRLTSDRTGGEHGRTVWLQVESGALMVTTAGKPAAQAAVRAA